MDKYLLGIDIGSSALKITFLSTEGRTVGPFGSEIKMVAPRPGYVEQNPDSWMEIFANTFSDAIKHSGIDPADIIAIAPDATTHTTVLLDRDFRPVRPAIMWNDQRSVAIAERLKKEHGELIFRLTNHEPGAMWSLCQNLWVKENEPEKWAKVVHMVFAKDYLRFCLTGQYLTDYIDAQGSQFFDVEKNEWSDYLCGLMGFERSRLPEIKKPTDFAGVVTEEAAKRTGLKAGTKVYVGTTDTVMEVFAAGAVAKGESTVKLATSGRICVVSDKAYPHPMLVNYSHVAEGLWYPGTGTRSCASSLRWFKDNFARFEEVQAKKENRNVFAMLDEFAEKIPVGSDKLFYHPYLLGEFTPYANANLRASFIGASYSHTTAHFARAIMEGCAYSLRDCFSVIDELGLVANGKTRLIGGGSGSKLWAGIVADVLQRTLVRPSVSDSSFGSAMLAGIGAGVFSDAGDAVAKCVKYTDEILPNPENFEKYNILFDYYKKIQKQLEGVYNELAGENI